MSGRSDRAYQLYQQKMTLSNALDFDDLIMKTVQLLRESEKAREHYQNRFRYVHCDEFQDVNDSQYQLLTLFSGKHKNICVVGDDDQCVVAGTPILTPTGYVPIEQITRRRHSLSRLRQDIRTWRRQLSRKSWSMTTLVLSVNITTTDSTQVAVRVTPNHVMFGFAVLGMETQTNSVSS